MRYRISANDNVSLPNSLLTLWRAELVPSSAVRVYLCLRRLSLLSEHPELPEPMSMRQLAAYCGVAPKTLKHALQILQDRRYIEIDKGWVVVKE